MGNPLDSPAFLRPISLTFCVSKLFEHIILSRLLFFLVSNSILSSILDQIIYLFQSIWHGFNKPKPAPGQLFLLSTSPKLLSLSGISPFSENLFRLAALLALLDGLNLSFLIGALAWFFKITKIACFDSVEVFRKDPFFALHFSVFSSMIFLLLCLLPSAALFTLST